MCFHGLNDPLSSDFYFQQADDLYNTMLKRFRQEKSVWVKYATFLLKRGLVEAAHKLLPRALKCLPVKERKNLFTLLSYD